MIKPTTGQVTLAFAALILGMMLAVQFRVQKDIAGSAPWRRIEDVTAVLKKVETEKTALQEEVASLRARLDKSAEGQTLITGLREELQKARIMAGLVDLKGPGIILTLNDSKKSRQSGDDPAAFIIHDDDILKVVNELAAAGAEAIAINGQRLVGTSEIRCAGPTISINNTRTAPPIEIKAIGDPQTLEASLMMRGGIIEALAFWGIDVKLTREKELIIPAYRGSLRFQHAQTVEKEGAN